MRRVPQMGIPSDGDSVALSDILVTIFPWWDGPKVKQAVQVQLAAYSRKEKKA